MPLKRDVMIKSVKAILEGAANDAAVKLRDLVTGKLKKMSPVRFKACIFVIEQSIGKARIPIEHSGHVDGYVRWDVMLKEALGAAGELPPSDPVALIGEGQEEGSDDVRGLGATEPQDQETA